MAVDMFLKLDGIKGESSDDKHRDEIEVESFHWGASQPSTAAFGGGGGAGKVAMQDFHFVMRTNRASPGLFLACASGQHIPEAILTVRKRGTTDQEYLKWTFSDVLISSYQTSAGFKNDLRSQDGIAGLIDPDGTERPSESVTLNYAKVIIEYKPQKPDGSLDAPIVAGWDLQRNVKI